MRSAAERFRAAEMRQDPKDRPGFEDRRLDEDAARKAAGAVTIAGSAADTMGVARTENSNDRQPVVLRNSHQL